MENDEVFGVLLETSAPRVLLSHSSAVITILNDDGEWWTFGIKHENIFDLTQYLCSVQYSVYISMYLLGYLPPYIHVLQVYCARTSNCCGPDPNNENLKGLIFIIITDNSNANVIIDSLHNNVQVYVGQCA